MGCEFSAENHEVSEKIVTFVGLDCSGKSALVYKITNQEQGKVYVPFCTGGVDFAEIPGTSVKIYDMGGLGRYREQWSFYISISDGVVFVIDRSDKERMYRVRKEIEPVIEQCSTLRIPLLILLNKSDIDTSLTISDIQMITNIANFNVEYIIQECSAKTGDGISKSKDWLLQRLKSRSNQNV